ncbi:hypothetical protein RJ639_018478 [Escallonia herrerae]|uniref:Pentatricopeptide repeat-containing protein n=1 Tax=Escallonia herrerae TaxID=1293975 RepID=A0AA89AJ56_9ASTE|nr:hypothetical protein RJ639_018478 [Escallonia herrerae]
MRQLKQIHAQIITDDTFFPHETSLELSKLTSFCAVSPNGSIPYAKTIFNYQENPSIPLYNALIRGFCCSKHPLEAVALHKKMLQKGLGGPLDKSGSALFIFGDSTVDTGNNNYMVTKDENQGDWKPYGQNGFREAMGRFSDGRIIVKFIGVLSSTNEGLAIDLDTQLKHWGTSIIDQKLWSCRGKAAYIRSGLFHQYWKYLGNPQMQELRDPKGYVGMVIGNYTKAIQFFVKRARRFGFLSLSPLGCLPALRAINPKANKGGCFEEASALGLAHNSALKAALTSLEH